MITYGYTVRWCPRQGEKSEISVEGCGTAEEAFWHAFGAAKRAGYRRPAWWQLSRRFSEIDYEALARKKEVPPGSFEHAPVNDSGT